MQKILLAVSSCFLISAANAQCTPDGSETQPGLHPTQAEGLATGMVGVAYSQTLTVIIPEDTTVDIFGTPTTIPIDDATVTGVSGLPSGFSYACNVSGCVFPGGTTNCAIITGTTGTAGTYPLEIYVTYHAGFISSDDTVTGYTIQIDPVGVWELNQPLAFTMIASPNPFTYNTSIDFSLPKSADVKITVYNLLGKSVKTETIRANSGANTYTLKGNNLLPGAYLVEVSDGKHKSTQRLIKQKD